MNCLGSIKPLFLLAVLILSSVFTTAFATRNEIEEFAEMEDRFGNVLFLRRPKTDFYFDLSAIVTSDAKSIIDEAEEKADSNDVNEVNALLSNNLNTEHQGFSNLRIGASLGTWDLGTDVDIGIRIESDFGVSASIGDQFAFVSPFGNTDAVIQFYGKWDYQAGFEFEWNWSESWSSGTYIYGISRRDYFVQAQGQQIVTNKDILNIADSPDNTETFLYQDLWLNYHNKNLLITLLFEQIKLADIADKEDYPGKINFSSNAPLTRVHLEYLLEGMDALKVNMFAGATNRKYYGWSDNAYLGSELFLGTFPLSMLLMVDSVYGTINPRIRWEFLQFEASYRVPFDRNSENFKRDDFWGANLAIKFDY